MTLWSNEWPAPKSDDASAAGAPVPRRPTTAGSAGMTLWSSEWRPPKSDDLSTGYAPPAPRPPRGAPGAVAPGSNSTGSAAALRLFSDHYPVTGPNAVQAFWERMGFSVIAHAVVGAIALAFIALAPKGFMTSQPMESIPFHDIIFLNQPGPGGGGGGGGNRMKLPEKKAELAGAGEEAGAADRASGQARRTRRLLRRSTFRRRRASTRRSRWRARSTVSRSRCPRAPAAAAGRAPGTGTGIGPGTGSGLGPGWGGGFGGGAYRPGSGIENPLVLREVRPEYTADAMRAKIQGMVQLECVVMPDGSVGEVRVTRSLDPVFGLDQKAIEAARKWRFVPGKLRQTGQPVAVLVLIELTFTLR